MSLGDRLARAFRGRRLDRNPLRRRVDRAETLAGIGLIVAFAVAAPITVHAATAGTYAFARDARASALATRHEVTAVTLQAAPDKSASPTAGTPLWVSASWTAPGGRQQTGQIQVAEGTPTGTAERIWVTRSGDPAAPPLPVQDLSWLPGLAGYGTVLGLAATLLIIRVMIRLALNRERMRAWDADWAVTEPRWNRQRW